MKKINLTSTKTTFMIWLVVTLVSNVVLARFGSLLLPLILCLVFYAAAWFLFMRSDIIEYMKKSKTPIISLCVTMLTFWIIVAFISASDSSSQAILMIRGIFMMLLIYSSAPVTYLAMYFGKSLDFIAQTIIPVMYAIVLLFRVLFILSYKRAVSKSKK